MQKSLSIWILLLCITQNVSGQTLSVSFGSPHLLASDKINTTPKSQRFQHLTLIGGGLKTNYSFAVSYQSIGKWGGSLIFDINYEVLSSGDQTDEVGGFYDYWANQLNFNANYRLSRMQKGHWNFEFLASVGALYRYGYSEDRYYSVPDPIYGTHAMIGGFFGNNYGAQAGVTFNVRYKFLTVGLDVSYLKYFSNDKIALSEEFHRRVEENRVIKQATDIGLFRLRCGVVIFHKPQEMDCN